MRIRNLGFVVNVSSVKFQLYNFLSKHQSGDHVSSSNRGNAALHLIYNE